MGLAPALHLPKRWLGQAARGQGTCPRGAVPRGSTSPCPAAACPSPCRELGVFQSWSARLNGTAGSSSPDSWGQEVGLAPLSKAMVALKRGTLGLVCPQA